MSSSVSGGQRSMSGSSTRQGSRSSRRILPPIPVELGGGAGVLGPVNDDQAYYAALVRVTSGGHQTASTPNSSYHSPTGSMFSISSKTTATSDSPTPIRPTHHHNNINDHHQSHHRVKRTGSIRPLPTIPTPPPSSTSTTTAAAALLAPKPSANSPASLVPPPYSLSPSSHSSSLRSIASAASTISIQSQTPPRTTTSTPVTPPPPGQRSPRNHGQDAFSSQHVPPIGHVLPHQHQSRGQLPSLTIHTRSASSNSLKRAAGQWSTAVEENSQRVARDKTGRDAAVAAPEYDDSVQDGRIRTTPPRPLPSFAQGPLPQTPPPSSSHPPSTETSPFTGGGGRLKARNKKAPAPIRTGRSDSGSEPGQDYTHSHHEQHQQPSTGEDNADRTSSDLTNTSPIGMAHHNNAQQQQQAKLGHGRPDKPYAPTVPLKDASMQRSATDPVKPGQGHNSRQHASSDLSSKSRSVTPTPGDLRARGADENSGRKTPTLLSNGGHIGNPPRYTAEPPTHGSSSGSVSRKTGAGMTKSASGQSLSHRIFDTTNHRAAPPPPHKGARPSVDMPRPSAEIITLSKMERDREARATANKGIGHQADASKRAPVLSLKKSSGALRNLFRSKREARDTNSTVSVSSDAGRPSTSDILRPTPNAAAPTNSRSVHSTYSAHSAQSSYAASSSQDSVSSRRRESPDAPSDSVLASEAANERFFSPPTMQRVPSRGNAVSEATQTSAANSNSNTITTLPPRSTSRRLPARQLPPLPPAQNENAARTSPQQETRSEPRAQPPSSLMFETPMAAAKELPQNAVSPAVSDSSASTVRQLGTDSPPRKSVSQRSETPSDTPSDDTESTASWSPIQPAQSLDLLQLPELDLAFDFSAFDAIGTSSPTTPRKASPMPLGAGKTSSPVRTSSVKRIERTDSDKARRAERRRSKSVDARGSSATEIDQSWIPSHMSKFALPTTISAPTLSSPKKLSPSDDWFNPFAPTATPSMPPAVAAPTAVTPTSARPSVPRVPSKAPLDVPSSVSSARSTPAPVSSPSTERATGPPETQVTSGIEGSESTSSLDHSRTPSGCSSAHETSSTSSPHTPEDVHAAFLPRSSPRPPAIETTTLKPTTATLSLDSPISLAPPIDLDVAYLGGFNKETASKTPTPPKRKKTDPKSASPVDQKQAQLPQQPRTPERKPTGDPPAAPVPASTSSTGVTVTPAVAAAAAAVAAATSGPSVPSPPTITTTAPPKAPEEPKEPEPIPPSNAPFRARPWSRTLSHKSSPIGHDPSISLRDLTRELERSLDTFRYPAQGGGPERSMIIRNELLLYCSELDKRCYNRSDEHTYHDLREVCFEWGDALLYELRVEQPANERGACLEGLAAVLECSALTADALESSKAHQDAFMQLMMRVMTFVMDKLGAKGVFHNTLLFSGRFLAFAFFRVPHVGGQLVGVLQPPRGALMRFTRPHLLGKTVPDRAQPHYPAHLQPLCFDDAQSYTRRLLVLEPEFATLEAKEAFHFQPGNWLRRWQSDDSELFPAFYRAYHRQLALYLGPAIEYYQNQNKPVAPEVLFRAPGYAHLATIFAKKCHSYILGSVNAVTTSSSNNSFDLNESAGFRGSQKPPVLETANRRLVEVLWTFASSIMSVPSNGRMIEVDGSQLWGEMIDVWMKNLITKTSLYSPKGVFCLFDMLDGIVDPVQSTSNDSPLDIPYIIGLVRTILNEAEHALTIVKAIAFVFTHWEILTVRPEDRRELCLDILLDKKLFERMLLFWSQSVRSYVLRLVVFRLGHLHTTKEDGASYEVEIESVRLLQTRLDRIKKRHDELEPGAPAEEIEIETTPRTPTTTASFPRSRSTITMVADSPQPSSKAEKLLGVNAVGASEDDKDSKSSKPSWWKRTLSSTKPKQLGKAASTKMPKTWKRTANAPAEPYSSPTPASVSTMSQLTGSPASGKDRGSPKAQPSTLQITPHLAPSLMPADPLTPSSPSSGGSSGGNGNGGDVSPSLKGRKGPPSRITTDAPAGPKNDLGEEQGLTPASANSRAMFQFEFELPTASPRSDAFDPIASPSSPSRRQSQPPSPRSSTSPHMSLQFSKRSSLLPPSTANALDSLSLALKIAPRLPPDPGYPRRLHAYAIRMLAELEDAQKEYDEWWSEGGIGKVDGAPPRLAVAWPFHEGED